MVVKILSSEISGIYASLIEVEVDISRGLSSFNIVGLPDTAVKESRDRIRAAVKNSSFTFPSERITVNLAPADMKKESSKLDIAVALGIVKHSLKHVPESIFSDSVFVGELSLDGKVRKVSGVLSIAMLARNRKYTLYVPADNYCEAVAVKDVNVIPYSSLNELVSILSGYAEPTMPVCRKENKSHTYDVTFDDIKGHDHAKRALIIASAGGHNLLMYGPPGSGKTMLARSVPSILPEMTNDERIMTTMIYSAGGMLRNDSIIEKRPFRAPHHTISHVGLVGGGTRLNPGEVSYAHNGVLFLDEFPEFSRRTLEVLRQPLEDGSVCISRASGTVEFPSQFNLIAAMNPCPCGFYGSKDKECICSPSKINHYRSKISGPLLDRIDMLVHIPQISLEEMKREKTKSEMCFTLVRKNIEEALLTQFKRSKNRNAYLSEKQMNSFCVPDKYAAELLMKAASKLKLSSRAYNRILKLSRTIADLEGESEILSEHIAEALTYRLSDFFGGTYSYD